MIPNPEGRARAPDTPPLAGYPAQLRRVIFWYDGLGDRQRVQYAVAAILFLVACGGYLLGLGSTVVLHRVEAEDAVLAAVPLPVASPPTVGLEAAALAAPAATADATEVPRPSPTALPTLGATRVPFSGPQIAEPPAIPRNLPVNPALIPPPATPTPAKPRNLETSKPEPPASSIATPTPGVARTALPVGTAVRKPTGSVPTARPTSLASPLPTLALPGTPSPTHAATPAATPQTRTR